MTTTGQPAIIASQLRDNVSRGMHHRNRRSVSCCMSACTIVIVDYCMSTDSVQTPLRGHTRGLQQSWPQISVNLSWWWINVLLYVSLHHHDGGSMCCCMSAYTIMMVDQCVVVCQPTPSWWWISVLLYVSLHHHDGGSVCCCMSAYTIMMVDQCVVVCQPTPSWSWINVLLYVNRCSTSSFMRSFSRPTPVVTPDWPWASWTASFLQTLTSTNPTRGPTTNSRYRKDTIVCSHGGAKGLCAPRHQTSFSPHWTELLLLAFKTN